MIEIKRNIRKYAVLSLLILFPATGCGKKSERKLESAEGAKSVIDYSAFDEKDIQIETEPVTETESETESEYETVRETETETEKETEIPKIAYTKDYDFSDDTVQSAFQRASDSERGEDFSDVAAEDISANQRTRIIHKGDLTVILSSYEKDTENVRIEIITNKQLLMDLFLSEIGIDQDESGYLNLYGGMYDAGSAGFIGLLNVSRSQDDDGVHIILDKKVSTPKEDFWSDESTPLNMILPDTFLDLDLDLDNAFSAILSGASYDPFSETQRTIGNTVISYDENGQMISTYKDLSAEYESSSEKMIIETKQDEEGSMLSFTLTSSSTLSDLEVLSRFEHIYQQIFHGEFEKNTSLENAYTFSHAIITRSGDTTVSMMLR